VPANLFPLSTLQDLIGAKDKATIFYLKLDDPAKCGRGGRRDQASAGHGALRGDLDGFLPGHDDYQQLSGTVNVH